MQNENKQIRIESMIHTYILVNQIPCIIIFLTELLA